MVSSVLLPHIPQSVITDSISSDSCKHQCIVSPCVTSLVRHNLVIGSCLCHIARTAQDGHWFFHVSHHSHATIWSLVLPCVTSLTRHKMVLGSSVSHHSHATRWSLVLPCVTSLARYKMVIGSSMCHVTRTPQDGH